jgi:uncharacterized membrane protein
MSDAIRKDLEKLQMSIGERRRLLNSLRRKLKDFEDEVSHARAQQQKSAKPSKSTKGEKHSRRPN